MALMIDTNLRVDVLANPARLVVGVDPARVNRQVHGCAVEIRIGNIYRPGTESKKPGSVDTPRTSYSLEEGETAVIGTMESFALDERHTAIVFPISSMSLKGLLMTNPGHVDPGFKGKLHVTVINMGREPFSLKMGDRLLRALIFDLGGPVATPSGNAAVVSDELMETLSPDFLSVRARVAEAAKREIDSATRRSELLKYSIPAFFAILGSVITGWYTNLSIQKDFDHRITTVEKLEEKTRANDRLLTLEEEYPTVQRLSAIELKLKELEQVTPRTK
jgi:dCTP deaminase